MANTITLFEYLQNAPPALPLEGVEPGPNTTHDPCCGHLNIHHIGHWTDFNLHTVLQQCNELLSNAMIQPDPFPTSPQPPIHVEGLLRDEISGLFRRRMRRALQVGFDHLIASNTLDGLSPVSFSGGEMAMTPGGFKPDIAYHIPAPSAYHRPNRAPGDIKLSCKWNTAMHMGRNIEEREFHQVLGQLYWYMRQHSARYGVILTDVELVAVRRLDDNGNIELSTPIPWEAKGTVHQPCLTVMLALWYIGMLASKNQGHDQWSLF